MFGFALGRALLVAVCLVQVQAAGAQAPAAADPWYGPSPRPKDFRPPPVALAGLTLELPKNWAVGPGHDVVVFTASEKPKNNVASAAIVLERKQLQAPFDPKDITSAVADIELADVREREPAGTGFEQQIKEAGGRRFIFVQYTKPGFAGPDRVVQYSIPSGAVMYRLICIAPAASITRYRPIFAHVAASFKPAAPAAK